MSNMVAYTSSTLQTALYFGQRLIKLSISAQVFSSQPWLVCEYKYGVGIHFLACTVRVPSPQKLHLDDLSSSLPGCDIIKFFFQYQFFTLRWSISLNQHKTLNLLYSVLLTPVCSDRFLVPLTNYLIRFNF
jgi:hypothetical protein